MPRQKLAACGKSFLHSPQYDNIPTIQRNWRYAGLKRSILMNGEWLKPAYGAGVDPCIFLAEDSGRGTFRSSPYDIIFKGHRLSRRCLHRFVRHHTDVTVVANDTLAQPLDIQLCASAPAGCWEAWFDDTPTASDAIDGSHLVGRRDLLAV